MYKKTLLSLAVASSLALTGCFESSSDSSNAGAATDGDKIALSEKAFREQFEGKTWPVFNPAASQVPIPSDFLIDRDTGDGSFDVDDTRPPVTTALNRLSGASTVAPFEIEFNGRLQNNTVIGPKDGEGVENAGIPLTQTVFLIELDYASNAPLQALQLGEGPGGDTRLIDDIEVDVEPRINGEGTETDYIRVTPSKPLEANKRYIVVITDEVKTQDGEPISQSPDYANLSSERAIPSPLQDARSLINFWERTANSVFNTPSEELGGASLSEARQDQLDLPALNKDSIALSYSFTTSNDVEVLSYIANPELWFRDQIRNFVRTSAVESLSAEERQDFDTAKAAADQANDSFKAASLDEDLAGPCGDLPEGEAQISCAGVVLSNFDGIRQLLPDVSAPAETAELDFDAAVSAVAKSAVLSNFDENDNAKVAEGEITLPYYLDAPIEEDPTERATWTANTDLASALNTVFADAGLELPQGTGDSDVVNSVFPFPAKTGGDITVPMLSMYPQAIDTDGDGSPDTAFDPEGDQNPIPVVIYQHGITTDRSAALSFGSSLAAQGIAVIAIDQPLHGVSPVPFTSGEEAEDPTSSLVGWSGLLLSNLESTLNETYEDNLDPEVGALAGAFREDLADISATDPSDTNAIDALRDDLETRAAEDITPDNGEPALEDEITNALVGNFVNTVSKSGSQIAGLEPQFTGQGINPDGPTERHFGVGEDDDGDFEAMDFNFQNAVGASGDFFINLENFTNNRDILRQGSVDMMALRAAVGSLSDNFDEDNVYFVGHSLGTLNGGAFVAAANASDRSELELKAANLLTPVGGVTRMIENSPRFAPDIVAGLEAKDLTQNKANYQTFLNVLQHSLDSVDPINMTGTPDNRLNLNNTLLSQIDGDQVVINDGRDPLSGTFDAEVDGQETQVTIDSPRSPLSGSEPLQEAVGSTRIDALDNLFDGQDSAPAQELPSFVRFWEDGAHTTPVLPDGPLEEAVFGQMVAQTAVMIGVFEGEQAAVVEDGTEGSVVDE